MRGVGKRTPVCLAADSGSAGGVDQDAPMEPALRAGRVRFPKALLSESLKTGLRGPRLMIGLNWTLRHR